MKVLMYVFPFILVSCSSLTEQRTPASESIQFHDAVTRTITRPINSEVTQDSSNSFSNGLVQILGQIGSELGPVHTEIKLVEASNESIKSLKLKRAFLYIEPAEGKRRYTDWYSRVFKGYKNVDFSFLKTVSIKVSDIEILNYDRKKSQRDVNENGTIYIAGSKDASKTKKILKSDPQLAELVEKMVVVDDLVFIHLKADAVEEHFKVFLSQNGDLLDKSGLTTLDVCSEKNCLEFDVADSNLAPLLINEGLFLDSAVKTSKIPDESKIKGFIEMEIKVEAGF